MEVKIGVANAPRELVFETTEGADQVIATITEAIEKEGDTLITLADDKGRKVLIPSNRLAYVEIGEDSDRRVGFAIG